MPLPLSPRTRRWGPALVLCVLGLLAYADAMTGSFHFDDAHSIVENPWIRSFRYLPRWLTDTQTFSVLPQNQDWRPLVLIAHALSYLLGGGLSPVAFHAVNLAIHLACACLTFLCAKELLAAEAARRGDPFGEDALLALSFLAGALFVLHPLQTETVDYLSSRSEGLTALGILAGFYCHLRGRPLGAVAWLAFGLSAKAVAIVLPALCFLHEVYLGELPWLRVTRKRVLEYAGFAAVAVGYLAIRHFLVSDLSVQARATTPRLTYAMTEVRAVWHYVGLYVFPVGQSGDANYPLTPGPADPDFLRALAAWGVVALLCAAAWRRARLPVFGLAWLLIVLAPTSTFFPLAEPVNEHRPYAGIAGLTWATVWIFGQLPRWAKGTLWERTGPRVAAAALVLLALLGATVARNRVWHDDISLWTDVVEKAPDSGRAHLNLGLALADVGRNDEALAQYDECAKAWSGYAYCPLDRGALLARLGRKAEALVEYKKAEALDPQLFWTPYYEGIILRDTDPKASKADLERSIALSPGYPAAHRELSTTLQILGDQAGARAELDRALALDPNDGEALSQRGYLEELAGDRNAAQADDRRALAVNPNQSQPYVNLGWMAEEDQRFAEARDLYLSASKLIPESEDVWRRLARAAGAAGDHAQEAAALAKAQALAKPPPKPPPPPAFLTGPGANPGVSARPPPPARPGSGREAPPARRPPSPPPPRR